MNKYEYLDCCKEQLLNVFKLTKNHKKDEQLKFRTEGFIHAGKALGVISHEEAVGIIAQAHFEVFGESIESRQNRKASLKEAVAKGDETFINIPAYQRLKL
ncbi:hypothetical protein [Colwellia sp. C1TZA3]|uniref:hypothetical protein n=1 Tax=Colwellia sp. C1TZA3 TaxID=2508879 RepID=UPI0011B9AFEE|nr:hypothetical protein [Colwellia sp. C1TZA3]TWX71432.1 hypothetical protein ESZ39_09510 [Colwellia sp. C1TZA3]